jgi:hypothetical protein
LVRDSSKTCLLVAVMATVPCLSSAAPIVRVSERESTLRLGADVSELRLVVVNDQSVSAHGTVSTEVLDVADTVLAQASTEVDLVPGIQAVDVSLGTGVAALEPQMSRLLLGRLRYALRLATPPPGQVGEATGLVALSEITPDVFNLRIVGSALTAPGGVWHAIVEAFHPVSRKPVPSVDVTLSLALPGAPEDADKMVLRDSTDAGGVATFDVPVPEGLARQSDERIDVEVSGHRFGLTAHDYIDITVRSMPRLILTTDQARYRPGTALYARLLAFQSPAGVLAGATGEWRIEDAESRWLLSKPMETSRFGAADLEWDVPRGRDPGKLVVRAIIEKAKGRIEARQEVSVVQEQEAATPPSPFIVEVSPDHPYYFSDQTVRLEIGAHTDAGAPVLGSVRVRVGEEPSSGGSASDASSGRDVAMGSLDAAGHLTVTMPSEDISAVSGDVAGTVSVVEAGTGRSAKGRFVLRLGSSPIEVRLAVGRTGRCGDGDAGCDALLYVATAYPDGRPASCNVILTRAVDPWGKEGVVVQTPDIDLASVRTNSRGVAKVRVRDLRGTPALEKKGPLFVTATATDDQGRKGGALQWVLRMPSLLLETSRALYARREAIKVSVSGGGSARSAFVEVVGPGGTLATRRVALRHGRGQTAIPYQDGFQGRLDVVAFLAEHGDDVTDLASRGILFPGAPPSKLNVRMDRREYQPGDTVRASIGFEHPPAHKGGELVSVAVVDATTRVDHLLRPAAQVLPVTRDPLAPTECVAGVTLASLSEADPSRIGGDSDLVAEVLLRRGLDDYRPSVEATDKYETGPQDAYGDRLASEVAPLGAFLDKEYTNRDRYPGSLPELRAAVERSATGFAGWRDPWEQPYFLSLRPNGDLIALRVMSAGPDETPDTDDDLVALERFWPYFAARGRLIDGVATAYSLRTGNAIMDLPTLRRELAGRDVDPSAWRDPWGRPLIVAFEGEGPEARIVVESPGENGHPDLSGSDLDDDIALWTTRTEPFARVSDRIARALEDHFAATGEVPATTPSLDAVLHAAGIDWTAFHDAWGHAYSVTFSAERIPWGKVLTRPYEPGPVQAAAGVMSVAGSRPVACVAFKSRGKDDRQDTPDDWTAASFCRLSREEPVPGLEAGPDAAPLETGPGEIAGHVADPTGAAVSEATLRLRRGTSLFREVSTDRAGRFTLSQLPCGSYDIEVASTGFMTTVVTGVPGCQRARASVDVRLPVGEVQEYLEVASSKQAVTATGDPGSTNDFAFDAPCPLADRSGPPSQTLVWAPEAATDARGRASVSFTLPNRPGTWKILAVGSDLDGTLAVGEASVTTRAE